ncbi:MAG: MFS transporter, partial [Gemmatimonadetes bacterium]|nr:MFS transporter [Gemmatimonadota bacterium]
MLSSYIDTVRLLNRDVRLVFATYAVFGFAWGGLYTLLFNLYLLRLGYDTDFIGVVNGISRFAFALGGLPAGMLGMRFGARRMILL